ncbi:PilN domain-containing protein [Candidatus Woesebacteria bacterium]|nr:PilN domain-containing protein [Candidatus Woesebacteria bacterium]
MAKKKRKNTINLIPREGFTATTSGRILVWALSTFRVVVIVTEIIVMIAFMSRFWLDAQNTDLNDEIKQKVAVLEATKNFEKEFENNQELLSIFSEFSKDHTKAPDSHSGITKSLPESQEFYLVKINYNAENVNLEGRSLDEFSIQQFLTNLESRKIFKSVSLGSVETDQEFAPFMKFLINIKL